MDRRQRKSREAIFKAFTELISKKNFTQITVGEIIEKADVGRATFYAHFETKDDLLKALCEELFCHMFDAMSEQKSDHRHIFDCDDHGSAFLHLFRHLAKNDNNILRLLVYQNNELFLKYFKDNLLKLAESQLAIFADRKSEKLPQDFWINHIACAFIETVRCWIDNGMKQPPEEIAEYFYLAV